jgi:hypothetical protein
MEMRTFGGTPGTVYDVTLRVRGVVEGEVYEGGTRMGKNFRIGGVQTTTPYAGHRKSYGLQVSAPAQQYWLNDTGVGYTSHNTMAVDYVATVKIEGGTTLKMTTFGCACLSNGLDRLTVDGLPPAPDWFLGQLLQVDVLSAVPAK